MDDVTSPDFLRRPTRVDNTTDNAANQHRLLSHVTLGVVEFKK